MITVQLEYEFRQRLILLLFSSIKRSFEIEIR